jgi:Nucleoporin Nup120/160
MTAQIHPFVPLDPSDDPVVWLGLSMALAEASAFLDHFGPGDVAHAVPTRLPARNPPADDLENHALDSAVCFVDEGFVLARTVENGIALELRYLSATGQPDTSRPPIAFTFPDVLVRGIAIWDDSDKGTLEILVLVESGYLFRLQFLRSGAAFYGELPPDYSHEYKIDALHSKKPVLLHAVGGQNAFVGCSDGSILHIEYSANAADISS